MVACSQQESNSPVNQAASIETSRLPSVINNSFSEAKPTDIYEQYAWFNRKTAADLKQVKQHEQANRIYDDYREQTDELLEKINQAQSDLLEDYYADQWWQYDEAKQQTEPSSALLAKKQYLDKIGLQYIDVGEGMAEIIPKPNTEPDLFAQKVSSDYRAFIVQQDSQNNQLAFSNETILIPWIQLGERVAFWEKFVQDYPQSALLNEAKQQLAWYADAFLFGLDNMPIQTAAGLPEGEIRNEAQRFMDEVSHAWNVFTTQNPQSKITPLITQARQIAELPDEERLAAIRKFRQQYADLLAYRE